MKEQNISADAEAAVLRDVERFSDELCVACGGVGRMGELPSLSEEKADRTASHSPAAALMLLLDDGQKRETHEIARRALRDWYLSLPDTKAYAETLTEQIDRENAEADEQDHRLRKNDLYASLGLPPVPEFPSIKREAA